MNIDELFNNFIEFPTDSKAYITTVSAKLFAKYCVDIAIQEYEEEHKIVLSDEEFELVMATMKNPPPTSEKLLEAARKMKANGGFKMEDK